MFERKPITINNKPALLVVRTNEDELPGFNSGTFQVIGDISFKGDYIEHISGNKLYVNVYLPGGGELNLETSTAGITTMEEFVAKFKLEHQMKLVLALGSKDV